jgi:hypothetical protein
MILAVHQGTNAVSWGDLGALLLILILVCLVIFFVTRR